MHVQVAFTAIGGLFETPAEKIAERLKSIKAFIFDWDGVFNNGIKGENVTSLYSEPDSMGTNLIRFGHWLKNRQMPFTAVITGENNVSAFQLAQREHFDAVYFRIKHKADALDHLLTHYGIKPNEVAYTFDDVLDFPIAEKCGVRFMIRRKASPLLIQYAQKHHLVDYITACEGWDNGVREMSELTMGLLGSFDEVISSRMHYTHDYSAYIAQRNHQETHFYTLKDGTIQATTI